MKSKGYKFAIKSSEQSEQLQAVLSKLGYSWIGHASGALYISAKHLFVEKEDGSITYGNNQRYFDNHDFKELDADKVIASGKLKAKSKWNKLADGMPPKKNYCYLVYCEDDKCQYTAYVSDTGEWMSWNNEKVDELLHNPKRITHWRKLPKNPKD